MSKFNDRSNYDIGTYPDSDGEYIAQIATKRLDTQRAFGRVVNSDFEVLYESKHSRHPREVVADLLNRMAEFRAGVEVAV